MNKKPAHKDAVNPPGQVVNPVGYPASHYEKPLSKQIEDYVADTEEMFAPVGCHRSHPHENMDTCCDRLTVEARHNNAVARKEVPMSDYFKERPCPLDACNKANMCCSDYCVKG